MKSFAYRTAGLVICLFAGFLSAGFLVAYCTWDCSRDALYWILQAVFWASLGGSIYCAVGVFRKLVGGKRQ